MSERATVFQATQLGVEVTKGTAIAASKRLLATSFKLKPVVPTEPFRPMGSKSNTTVTRRKEHTQGGIEGVLAYNDIVYLLSGLLESAAITTPTGATNARRWTFKPANYAVDDYITYTVETGSSTAPFAERCVFGLINGLTLKWSKEEASVTGDLVARETTEGITITGSPTDIAELPVDPTQISVYVGSALTNNVWTVAVGAATTGTFIITITDPISGVVFSTSAIAYNALNSAVKTAIVATGVLQSDDVTVTGTTPTYTVTLGGRYTGVPVTFAAGATAGGFDGTYTVVQATPAGLTQLRRCLSAEWGLSDRFNEQFTLDASIASFSAEVEKAFNNTAQIVLQHDAVSQAFMTDLRAKTTKFCKMIMHGSSIETGFPTRIALTYPFKFVEPDRDDKDDVWAGTYNLAPIYNPTFAGFVEFQVDNALVAL